METLEDFINRLRPKKKVFLPSLPSVSSILDGSDKRLIAILTLDPSDWSSKMEFQKYNSAGVLESTKSSGRYYPDQKMVLASTASGLVNLTDSSAVTNAGFTSATFGLASSQSATDYVSWLVGGIKRDIDTKFRDRASMLTDERRQIGDSLDSPIVMMGQMNAKISAPEFLAFGSNDGMLKIFRANPKIGSVVQEPVYNNVTEQTEYVSVTDESPYEYQFAYIPGLAKKEGNENILNTLSKRGEHMYGQDALNPHVYGVNGGLFYRTTDKGQTFIVGTLGQGARAAFALNIAGKDQITGSLLG